MGIQDRDYYRKSPSAARQILTWTQSAVGLLIATNVVVFIVQLAGQDSITRLLSAQADQVFSGHVWKLLTANFAHSTTNPWHIVGNMMFLWFLGREVEQIYGRTDFLILYLSAGVLAILAECLWNFYLGFGGGSTSILGASGAVMAVVALCTLFYPKKRMSLFFLPPAPLWLICIIYVGMDLFGVLHGSGQGRTRVANIAHLAGALVGFLYWFLDLRVDQLRRKWGLPRRMKARAPTGKILQMPHGGRPRAAPSGGVDPVYQRVDELLAKIHAAGMESLSGEELEFLKSNAGRFRRDGEPE